MFSIYFQNLGIRFVAASDWNALFGSRCTDTRGRELEHYADTTYTNFLSTGESTNVLALANRPSDPRKLANLLDFFLSQRVTHMNIKVECNLDRSTGYKPVILIVSVNVFTQEKAKSLVNNRTDCEGLRCSYINQNISILIDVA